MSIAQSRAGSPYLYTNMRAHRAEVPSLLCFSQRAALSPLTSWSQSGTDVSVFFFINKAPLVSLYMQRQLLQS